jgi:hypothetical protein
MRLPRLVAGSIVVPMKLALRVGGEQERDCARLRY